jgi:alkanesulfonate monooxygenase SsuD/methylene tetrahydromethanopterin reductase-like flavin-dependent oxidoreductase (luciferase family)
VAEVVAVVGPKTLAPAMNFSGMAERSPRVSAAVREAFVAVRSAYQPPTDEGDPATRHLRRFRGYLTSLTDEQRELVTPDVLRATAIAGSPEQCVGQLRALEAAGVTHVALSPVPQHLADVIDVFGRDVLPHLS